MRTVNLNSLISLSTIAVVFILGQPNLVRAQNDDPSAVEARQDPAELWIPSVAIHAGGSIQNWDAASTSVLTPGPGAADPTPVPIRLSRTDHDIDVSPVVGISVELMTPELPIPLRPRLVMGVEVIPIAGFERALARRGDPGPLRAPLDPGSLTPFSEDVFIGQGTKVTGEMDEIAWGAYLGMSFPFKIFDRPLRIKPNVSWIRYEVDFTGFISDAECVNPSIFAPTVCNAATSSVRMISLAAQESQVFNAIGPGVDLELETTIFRKVGSAIFIGFRAYHVLGDREVAFSASETFNDGIGTGDVAVAQFRTEVDEWIYRVVFGFRVELQSLFD